MVEVRERRIRSEPVQLDRVPGDPPRTERYTLQVHRDAADRQHRPQVDGDRLSARDQRDDLLVDGRRVAAHFRGTRDDGAPHLVDGHAAHPQYLQAQVENVAVEVADDVPFHARIRQPNRPVM